MDDQRPIASRELRAQRDDGTTVVIHIDLYGSRPEAEGEWHCRYRIVGLTRRPIDESSVGIDGIQAVHLAIQQIANWISIYENDPGIRIQWSEGSEFNNLELCRKPHSTRRAEPGVRSRAEAFLDWEIDEAFSIVRNDPDAAERAFKRMRRRAARRGSIDAVVLCLSGLLAVARRKRDVKTALRMVTAIATTSPTRENMLACAKELHEHGRDAEARVWYEKVLPQLEEGTSLHRFVSSRLNADEAVPRKKAEKERSQ